MRATVAVGGQRLRDYCNRLEGPLELTDACGELLVDGEVRDRWEAASLNLQLDRIDVLTSKELRPAGDPTLRVSMPSRSLGVVLPAVRVTGMVRVPEGASRAVLPGIQQRLSGASLDPDGRARFVRQLEQLIASAPGDD